MLNRTGHFWEKRYFCEGFPASDRERALNTLRYIHGNPKAAKMRSGFFYEFSNYGSYDQLTNDGLTQWHPAFLQLGSSLSDCARKYRGFCHRYQPKSKPARKCDWGNKFLAGFNLKGGKEKGTRANSTPPSSPPVLSKSGAGCQVSETPEVRAVAERFIKANQAPRQEKRHV
ncbi:MAG TPA: transposase [Cyanobacteria bacterium UBA11372]|nr:transposase [Cyanobacteria bacterium UBA11372]